MSSSTTALTENINDDEMTTMSTDNNEITLYSKEEEEELVEAEESSNEDEDEDEDEEGEEMEVDKIEEEKDVGVSATNVVPTNEKKTTAITLVDVTTGASLDITPEGKVTPNRKRPIGVENEEEEEEEEVVPVKAFKRGGKLILSFGNMEYPIEIGSENSEKIDITKKAAPETKTKVPKIATLKPKDVSSHYHSTYPYPLATPLNNFAAAPLNQIYLLSPSQVIMEQHADDLNNSNARPQFYKNEQPWILGTMSYIEFNLLMRFFELNKGPEFMYFTAMAENNFKSIDLSTLPSAPPYFADDAICKYFPVYYESGSEPTHFIPVPRGPTAITFTADPIGVNINTITDGLYFDMWISDYPPIHPSLDEQIPWPIPDESKIPLRTFLSPPFIGPTRSYTNKLYLLDTNDKGDGNNLSPFRSVRLSFGRLNGKSDTLPPCPISLMMESLTPRTRLSE